MPRPDVDGIEKYYAANAGTLASKVEQAQAEAQIKAKIAFVAMQIQFELTSRGLISDLADFNALTARSGSVEGFKAALKEFLQNKLASESPAPSPITVRDQEDVSDDTESESISSSESALSEESQRQIEDVMEIMLDIDPSHVEVPKFVKIDENYWVLINGDKQYLYQATAFGAGINGSAHLGMDIATGALVAIKMQCGALLEGRNVDRISFVDLGKYRAQNEAAVAADYITSTGKPLGLGMVKLESASTELKSQIFSENTLIKARELEPTRGDLLAVKDVYCQIQTFIKGVPLNDFINPEINPDVVIDTKALGLAIAAELQRFMEITKAYHGDLRPENVMVDFEEGKYNITLIDTGGSIRFANANGVQVGFTEFYSHQDLAEDAHTGDAPSVTYREKYEAFSLQQILIKDLLLSIGVDVDAEDRPIDALITAAENSSKVAEQKTENVTEPVKIQDQEPEKKSFHELLTIWKNRDKEARQNNRVPKPPTEPTEPTGHKPKKIS